MELDDLRRQWQRPEAVAPAALTATELTQLVAQQSGSILAKLRRNARLELGFNYALLPVSVLLMGWSKVLWVQLFGGVLALLGVVCIYYFHRKLGLLRDMDNPTHDLRSHLLRITQGLRALIQFYYRLTLAMIPVTMLINLVMVLSQFHKPLTPLKIGLIVLALALLGALIYLPTARTTTWYMQRLYGQHLDRLEGQLQELDEGAAPRSAKIG